MESFGLFDLFKSLLAPNGAENAQPTPESTSVESSAPTPASTAPPTQAMENSPSPNAFLDFIHTHDERAKRTKNK